MVPFEALGCFFHDWGLADWRPSPRVTTVGWEGFPTFFQLHVLKSCPEKHCAFARARSTAVLHQIGQWGNLGEVATTTARAIVPGRKGLQNPAPQSCWEAEVSEQSDALCFSNDKRRCRFYSIWLYLALLPWDPFQTHVQCDTLCRRVFVHATFWSTKGCCSCGSVPNNPGNPVRVRSGSQLNDQHYQLWTWTSKIEW